MLGYLNIQALFVNPRKLQKLYRKDTFFGATGGLLTA